MRSRGFLCYSVDMKIRKRSKENNLIPFEQTRKVIRLDKRGRRKLSVGRTLMGVLTGALALLCMLYCLSILLFMGYGTKFFLIWGVIALGLMGMSYLFFCPEKSERIPKVIRRGFLTVVALGVLLFIGVEGLIFSGFRQHAEPGADVVIVLGAQWKNGGPSYVLAKRLDAALAYLKDNPDTMVIVSGGQGSDEPISEAEGMAGYLEAAGIEPERIIQENASTDTNENLEFSAKFTDKAEARVVIVTNNFHVYRAMKIAQKKGYAHVEGLAADSYPTMLPNNLLREFFGMAKDFCAGNL